MSRRPYLKVFYSVLFGFMVSIGWAGSTEEPKPSENAASEVLILQLKDLEHRIQSLRTELVRLYEKEIAGVDDPPNFHQWARLAVRHQCHDTRMLALEYEQAQRRKNLLIQNLAATSQPAL